MDNQTKKSRGWFSKLNESGVTIIEGLVAAALITVGLLAMAGVAGVIMDTNNKSDKKTIAITLAQDKIEYFKGLAKTTPFSDTTGSDLVDAEGNTGGSDALYSRSWTVDEYTNEYFYFNVGITVSWTDGGTQSVTLNTEITQ